jgi:predicted transcriptional regulator
MASLTTKRGDEMTVAEYAKLHNLTNATARRRLNAAVAAGAMRKAVYVEMEQRRQRGYSAKLMPVRVANYFEV